MTGVYHCDSIEEKEQQENELESNPDFTLVGHFDMIQDIYFELNEQGFTDEQIEQFSMNRYGNCLEIIEYASSYTAYFGAR